MNQRILLSPNFWLHEFERSEVAARRGREVNASEMEIENLRRLCVTVLEPLRESLNAVITVTSGLRPEWLNTLVGGSSTSDHKTGCAADIIAKGYTPREVCQRIIDMKLPYRQVILEYDRWTHVSVPALRVEPAMTVLTARVVGGRTQYLPGIA